MKKLTSEQKREKRKDIEKFGFLKCWFYNYVICDAWNEQGRPPLIYVPFHVMVEKLEPLVKEQYPNDNDDVAQLVTRILEKLERSGDIKRSARFIRLCQL